MTLLLELLLQVPPRNFPQLRGKMERKRVVFPRDFPFAKLRSFRVRNGSRDDHVHHIYPVVPHTFHMGSFTPNLTTV